MPDSAYLVVATPRSGSTLLCETLRATGVAGIPLEHFEVLRHSSQPRQPREHFDGVDDPEVLDLLSPLDPPRPDPEPAAAWWARIVAAGTTPNGVWGGKLMWGHVGDLLARAHELDEVPPSPDLGATLTALLGPELRLVFVTRPDKVAQAVSLWRAVQTQTWRAGRGTPADQARYSFAGIDHLVAQLEDHDAAWRTWFAASGRTPHEVSYDDLAADPAGVVGGVLRFLGLPDDDVPAPATERQGNARSAAWADRYRGEREAVA
ncbi:Trehalose 2-sulfotransferase [Baekduia alba]|uniref:Stf0 family sulfotransferase n=1 Tax=Baekduia alba TaxID=2997333 RepID=UPI0023423724|nr:Stf0 family sulfotransferase [Baekduia alba]WCB95224.1 Trehalose 2-sulfotransferase [Baekduia alba]